ncbi:MAG: sugar-binding domain-containing protein [Propionicimonas sp.]|uniref:sugar-binding transcriptional regulator n=1 Tax=Propionicimonas sp. TaxID=1955623 RepID=UPI002B21C822|nr:sugar-binding domain-containing protein [Propionicimonas sp.]MEA4944462.1 sugar-binding domain-containing protein [Propionicimonas sp.]MEA5053911.1 sugar-binding domain-containing protein [Propionicimonas sp.]MEA5118846.1 sugar-binding domain-containing protein [Propionicimonas sp.]
MNDRYEDMYQAATRYYIQGETMESIAHQLRLSRSSVSRLLKEARESGLVRISLADHTGSQSPLAATLASAFGVRVHLVPVRESANENLRFDQVARLAGRLFTEAVDDHQLIGVAWGVTLSHVVRHLGRRPLVGSTVVQMNGGANQRSSGIPYIGEILQSIGDAFDAKVVLFPVPAFFDYPATKQAMWRERSVQNVLRLHAKLDLAVFGVGSLQGVVPSHVYSAGYMDSRDMEKLVADGVVGDVCTVLLREDGTYIDIDYNQRATGLTPAELQTIPRRICVVADPSRAPAVVGALRARTATDLVVDESTARAIADRARL